LVLAVRRLQVTQAHQVLILFLVPLLQQVVVLAHQAVLLVHKLHYRVAQVVAVVVRQVY
jgi:hypothetical protein